MRCFIRVSNLYKVSVLLCDCVLPNDWISFLFNYSQLFPFRFCFTSIFMVISFLVRFLHTLCLLPVAASVSVQTHSHAGNSILYNLIITKLKTIKNIEIEIAESSLDCSSFRCPSPVPSSPLPPAKLQSAL